MIIPAGRALKVIETTTVLELRHERKCRYEKSWVSTNGLKDERLVVESHMVQYFVLFVSLLVKTLSRLIWSWNVDFWEILSSVLSFSIFVENGLAIASVVQNLITWSPWPKFPDIFSPLFPPRLSPTWHVASDLERKVHNPRRPRAAPPLPCIWERLWLPWNDHWFGLKFTTPKGVVLVKLWTSGLQFNGKDASWRFQ